MSSFTSDARCLGGKNQIMNLMTNHYSALVNAKPTLNTREKAQRPPRPQTSKPKSGILNSEQWAEQRETIKRCQRITGEVDHFPPQTFVKFRNALGKNKVAKMGDHEDREHLQNLRALQRRVENVSSAVERKKNPFDPLNNPVKLFRHGKTEAERVSLNDFKKRMDQQQKALKQKNEAVSQQWLIASKEHSHSTRLSKMRSQSASRPLI